jgi:septum site-determining protein MinC
MARRDRRDAGALAGLFRRQADRARSCRRSDLSGAAIAHLGRKASTSAAFRVLGIEGVEEERLATNMPPVADRRPRLRDHAKRAGAEARARSQAEADVAAARMPGAFGSVDRLHGRATSPCSARFGSGRRDRRRRIDHIYGTLRGRAMAGVNGNGNARIYCQKIEAELLAIDGYYQTAEEIDVSLRNRPAQAWLQGDTMKITPLN